MNKTRYSIAELSSLLEQRNSVILASEVKYKTGVVIFQAGAELNQEMLQNVLAGPTEQRIKILGQNMSDGLENFGYNWCMH